MPAPLPCLILTGASGVVGRSFLEAAQDHFHIYALARRPQRKAGIPPHPNVHWLQVDIGNREALRTVMAHLRERCDPQYVLHLAAHYDFENVELPDYQHTNIDGTRYMLEEARKLGVEHFIFASSVAACEFPDEGDAITEATPTDADFPYARSKRAGEQLVREYAQHYHCSIVRLAAVFSDWGEYPPLYVFLTTWLSKRWNARILGGRGLSAVPYIHTRDVNRLLLRLLERTGDLPSPCVYLASPDGATSQRELYDLATNFQFRRSIRPILMPKPLAWLGILVRDLWGRLLGRRPFERLWMVEYVDRPLTTDASRTRELLGWSPTPRLHVLRRLLFLIEKTKSRPHEWVLRNERAMKRPVTRPSLVIHDAMVQAREAILDAIVAYLQSPVRQHRFPDYATMGYSDLRWYTGVVYDLLSAAVRTGDRGLLLSYAYNIAQQRFAEGFPASEVCEALLAISDVTVEELSYKPEVAELQDEVRDSIRLSIALAVDGVQDAFDLLRSEAASGTERGWTDIDDELQDLESVVERLNAFYKPIENGTDRRMASVG